MTNFSRTELARLQKKSSGYPFFKNSSERNFISESKDPYEEQIDHALCTKAVTKFDLYDIGPNEENRDNNPVYVGFL